MICCVTRLTESCRSDQNFALTRKLFTLVKSNRYSTSNVDVENCPRAQLLLISKTIPTMVHVLLKFYFMRQSPSFWVRKPSETTKRDLILNWTISLACYNFLFWHDWLFHAFNISLRRHLNTWVSTVILILSWIKRRVYRNGKMVKNSVLCDQYFCVGNDLCKQYSCALHQTQSTIKSYTGKLCLRHICLTVLYPWCKEEYLTC